MPLVMVMVSCSSDASPEDLLPGNPPPTPPQILPPKIERLRLEVPEAGAAQAGICKIIRVHSEDLNSQSVAMERDTQLILSAESGYLFGNDRCESPAGTLTWKAGESFATISFLDDRPGESLITVDESPPQGWQAGQASVAVIAPNVQVSLQLNKEVLVTGQCDAIELKLLDRNNQSTMFNSNSSLVFSGTMSDGAIISNTRIYENSDCSNSPEQFEFPARQSSLRLYIQSFDPGSLVLRSTLTIQGLSGELAPIENQRSIQVQSALEGTWKGDCSETSDGLGMIPEWQVNGRNFIYRENIYDSCLPQEPLRSTWEHTGELREAPLQDKPTTERSLDLIYESSCLLPASNSVAESFNSTTRCGLSNWQAQVCFPLTGRSAIVTSSVCPANKVSSAGDVVRETLRLEALAASGTTHSRVTFASSSLYPGQSLNNPNLRPGFISGIELLKGQ